MNFEFKNFNDTNTVISAIVSLDILVKELREMKYDFSTDEHNFLKINEHNFIRDDLFITIITENNEIEKVIFKDIENTYSYREID